MNLFASIPTYLRLLAIDYMFKCPFLKRVIQPSRLFLHCDIDARFVFHKTIHSDDCLLIKLVGGFQVGSVDARESSACADINIKNEAHASGDVVLQTKHHSDKSADTLFVNLWVVLSIYLPGSLNLLFASQSINRIEMSSFTYQEIVKITSTMAENKKAIIIIPELKVKGISNMDVTPREGLICTEIDRESLILVAAHLKIIFIHIMGVIVNGFCFN